MRFFNKTRLSIIGAISVFAFLGLNQNTDHINLLSHKLTQQDLEIEQAYLHFLSKYGKVYSSKQETLSRFSVFKQNYHIVTQHNLRDDIPFQMELNQFSDMTDKEFEDQIITKGIVAKHGKQMKPFTLEEVERIESQIKRLYQENEDPEDEENNENENEEPAVYNGTAKYNDDTPLIQLPLSVNWFEEGAVTRPYNQKFCGSCWAFSAASVLESLAFMSGHDTQLKEFSVQNLLDCDTVDQNGCSGGWMWQAFNYTKHNGIALKTGYGREYTGAKQDCIYSQDKAHFKPTNLGMIEKDRNVNLALKRLVSKQPISIAIYAPSIMSKYKNGVLTEDFIKCSSPNFEVNHGVVLVGYGKVQKGDRVRGICHEYWIIRNSWGAEWGENGFFKLCMDGVGSKDKPFGSCLVNKYATWPTLDGTVIEPVD